MNPRIDKDNYGWFVTDKRIYKTSYKTFLLRNDKLEWKIDKGSTDPEKDYLNTSFETRKAAEQQLKRWYAKHPEAFARYIAKRILK